ncbi:MAG: TonB-dependent receptor [Saprospiraceae bacterium]|nr:TonB-dependent receptor [Saprospiraceae bacterium]
MTFVVRMRLLTIICLIFLLNKLIAQSDSIQLNEVIITATKTERSIGTVPMPVSVIKAKMINLSGSSRLQDILNEQSGLNVVAQINGFGNGIQMQGLNPDYTMILLDGEPIIGRLTGNLELNRVTLANVKKIEIIKGPSSSLYGSEALGGVINIITKSPLQSQLELGLKYATNNTVDASLNTNWNHSNLNVSLFGNHYRTAGFDFHPDIYGQTVSPYSNSTLQFQIKQDWHGKHLLLLNTKAFRENQENNYQVVNASDSIRVFGKTQINDYSISPQYKLKLGERAFVNLTSYGSIYQAYTYLNQNISGLAYYTDSFEQRLFKPEIQASCFFNAAHKYTIGAGLAYEGVKTNRYDDDKFRTQLTNYLYIQHEFSWHNKVEWVNGIRYDMNPVYGNQWSPKTAIQWTVFPELKLKASFGTGFKSPDFRYLYLNFRNAAAGYFVYGTSELKSELELLDQKGEIQQYLYDVNLISKLFPEKSIAFNLGAQYDFHSKAQFEINLFRNDLKNLIETQAVAITKDLKTIYSYANIKKAYTQGIEASIRFKLKDCIQTELNSQVLFAKDKEVLKAIEDGFVFGRDPVTKLSYQISKSDYFGLYNRSRHTESIKLFYENSKSNWNASLRLIYKSKFGISNTAGSVQGNVRPSSDANSNAILDRFDHFVSGYYLCNISISKLLYSKLKFQIGADNVFNYTDQDRIPNLFGRNLYITINYKIIKN